MDGRGRVQPAARSSDSFLGPDRRSHWSSDSLPKILTGRVGRYGHWDQCTRPRRWRPGILMFRTRRAPKDALPYRDDSYSYQKQQVPTPAPARPANDTSSRM
eukprot:scaffold5093_cov279-Pinguiococcus_pyrenoidosus.AAC.2